MIRSLLVLAAALTFLATSLATSACAQVIPDAGPEWEKLGEASAAAAVDGRLLMIYAYASWCGWCTKLEQDVLDQPDVKAYLKDHYHAVALDIESDEEITFQGHTLPMHVFASAVGASATPTTIFVDTDGSLITKLPGFHDAPTFLLALRYVREEIYETTDFADYLEANLPSDGAR
ncbi:MAG: thioredoxin family protein [Rubricoccaceae bacterium]